jgi:hypothetical protein
MKMEQTECSETSAHKIQTPGNYPEENIQQFNTCYMKYGFTYLPLKKGPTGCPETSVRNYHNTLRNNPEECSAHLLRGGNLKSRDH